MKLFRRISTSLLLITFSVLLLGATGDRARFNDLGHRMMCVCGCNQILLECNHVGCTYSDRMREQLSAAIQQESNDENILQTFVKEYGTTVLAAPTMRGFDRVAWIMPFAVFLAGSLLAVVLIRNWKSRQPPCAVRGAPAALDRYREKARRETSL
ncbi:MAG: C cytochromes biosynthesis protein [Acidobacteria bacterium]|nr:MAG: C cytochromes biosynthesis protein [Acidobacteriota bacterium]